MEARIVITLLKKEINDALNNRWFVLYAGAFTGLSLLLSWLSLSSGGLGYTGFASFGRTAASLVNLVLLVAPLSAVFVAGGGGLILAWLLAARVHPRLGMSRGGVVLRQEGAV